MSRLTRKSWITASGWIAGFALVTLIVYPNIVRIYKGFVYTLVCNELKGIAIALHQYHDEFGTFPPAVIQDEDGIALHSWRAVLLPFIAARVDVNDDFTRYDLDQPWNSVANQQSSEHHSFASNPYKVLSVVGPHAAWCEDRPRSMSEFTDGTADTILLIAMRNTGTQWHQPIDAVVAEDGTLTLNGKPLDTSANMFFVTADGSIHRTVDLDPAILKALLTIDAGDPVPEWW